MGHHLDSLGFGGSVRHLTGDLSFRSDTFKINLLQCINKVDIEAVFRANEIIYVIVSKDSLCIYNLERFKQFLSVFI